MKHIPLNLLCTSLLLTACGDATGPEASSTRVARDTLDPTSTGVELVLVNADLDTDIATIADNDVFALAGPALTIRADIVAFAPPSASVLFFVDGEEARTENIPPYAVAGDQNGDFAPFSLGVGTHVVNALVFDQPGANGNLILSVERTFTLVDNGPQSAGVELLLVDSNTDQDVALLQDGDVIDETGTLTLRAQIVAGPIDDTFVQFFVDGSVVQTERVEPYALAGDSGGAFIPWDLSPGTRNVSAFVFLEQPQGNSLILSTERTFEIR